MDEGIIDVIENIKTKIELKIQCRNNVDFIYL